MILKPVNNEDGSVLNVALLILVMLTLIGIYLNISTTTDIRISRNEKAYMAAFYKADGGTEVGAEMLEQNLGCPGGFTDNTGGEGALIEGVIMVDDVLFWQKTEAASPPSNSTRDIYFPVNYATGPHTNITIGGDTYHATGSAIQMAAGYEGKGKGAAGGGTYLLYDINSQYIGPADSLAMIAIQWRHIIGQEGDCNY